jgi:hypothetical protein
MWKNVEVWKNVDEFFDSSWMVTKEKLLAPSSLTKSLYNPKYTNNKSKEPRHQSDNQNARKTLL